MKRNWTFAIAAAAAMFVLGALAPGAPQTAVPAMGLSGLLGATAAEAQAYPPGAARRSVRRTARRTSRRVTRRHSIAGCHPYNSYYNCGGVYYRPVVQNGTTVYVVVNP
ncbi:hypothetical protein [Rhodobium gokarnense]|uniref:Uncharacterized protein n=1 Tax=Rhodobium gokarnense TaxID=364296 RepID=A0ABT3HGQ2_9HYPH|nr:hypothetical protein [Rhodobium gokarnense]MCW2309595.1 hypothetical protein [Rhodobium gokarnense]